MNVPFVDLKAQYLSIKEEIDNIISQVVSDTAFIGGNYVKKFERDFSEKYSVENVISCANGTDAIYIALKSLGVGIGDEVITVANTWISTAETITLTGAKPVFVDIDPDTYNIDTKKIEEKITDRTKAIVPVHLFGHPAEMDTIKELCEVYKLFLVEDCAQAHFAEYKGKKVGTFGNVGTFSFYPGKNLGAYGDAGAIITKDSELAKKMRMYANHGALKKHNHIIEGINSRLDGIQAAILSIKLNYIDEWTNNRIENALAYNKLLEDNDCLSTPIIKENSRHVFHLYVVRIRDREKVRKILKEKNISTGIHYPTPLPFLKAYSYLNHRHSDFPVAYDYMNKILSLPMYPELNFRTIKVVVEELKSSLEKIL